MKRSVYSRPDKAFHVPVTRRERFAELDRAKLAEPVTVDRATECHVTPDDVAARMVEYLGPVGDWLTLEPSAGTGQLSRALIASGHSKHELVQVERHHKLCAGLYQYGTVNCRCFLEWAAEITGKVQFPRIIMNPPFSDVRKHVKAALSLLGHGGHAEAPVIVALVPITFDHPDAEIMEQLPADTFALAKVNTKIIRIELTAR